MENLFWAWDEFKRGKRQKSDVQRFEFNLENNLFKLHQELENKLWNPDLYVSFFLRDPKLRKIHKASVRDRVLNQAVFRILYQIFDRNFIFDSYSCRLKKGTHGAVSRLQEFFRKASKNNTKTCFILKCDIKKFFNSIDQDILFSLIKRKIKDTNVVWLVEKIIRSFSATFDKGLPLGNVTSQLFSNIYLNELDQFAKHCLKIKHYIRYCDDFVVLNEDKGYLTSIVSDIARFLKSKLKLSLHQDKIEIRKYYQGIDFLGYVSFPYHRVLRKKTKKRMLKRIKEKIEKIKEKEMFDSFNQTVQSYFGILKHCEGYKIKKEIENIIFKDL